MFGGYPSFVRLPRALAAKRALGPLWPLVSPAAGVLMPERLRHRWRHFARTNGSFVDAYRVQRGFVLPDELNDLAGPALRDAGVWREACGALDAAERALLAPLGAEAPQASVARLESRLYLESQLLRDVDVMAMAHGLEVRVPFVDHELLDTVWPELGRHPSLLRRKRLLFETLERPLPEAIVGRPKQGFTLPFADWMRGELAPVVQDGLGQLERGGWIAKAPPRGSGTTGNRAPCTGAGRGGSACSVISRAGRRIIRSRCLLKPPALEERLPLSAASPPTPAARLQTPCREPREHRDDHRHRTLGRVTATRSAPASCGRSASCCTSSSGAT